MLHFSSVISSSCWFGLGSKNWWFESESVHNDARRLEKPNEQTVPCELLFLKLVQ